MNLTELQQFAGKKLGFKFKFPSELSASDRESLYDEMARYVQANPALFNPNESEWAKKRLGGSFYGVPLEGYSIGDAVSDFAGEVGNQVVSINDAINPFSESNRKVFFWLAVAGVAAYFLTPVIIKAVASVKSGESSR